MPDQLNDRVTSATMQIEDNVQEDEIQEEKIPEEIPLDSEVIGIFKLFVF